MRPDNQIQGRGDGERERGGAAVSVLKEERRKKRRNEREELGDTYIDSFT